jgi:hypothetical protein
VKYWTSTVFNPDRIGGPAYESNQAIAACGVLLFLLGPHWWWHADDGWTWLTVTVGNAYVWFAVAMVGVGLARSASLVGHPLPDVGSLDARVVAGHVDP